MKSLGSLFQVGYYYFCYYFSVYYHVKKINQSNSCYGYFHYVLYSLCSCKVFGVIFVFGSYLESMRPPRVGGREEDQKLLWEGQSRRSETKQGGRAGWGVAKAVALDEESVGQKGWWPYVLTGSIRHEEKSRKRGLHSTHWYFWNTTSGQSGMPFVLPAAKWSSKNSHGVECRLFFPLLPPSACPTLPLSFSGVTTVLPSHGCISYLTNHKEKNTPKLQ